MATMYQYGNGSPAFVHFAQKHENYDAEQISFQVRILRQVVWNSRNGMV